MIIKTLFFWTFLGNCFDNGQYPNKDNWYCDWTQNSPFYYNYFGCNSFPSSPAQNQYYSYINNIPGSMYSMMKHTTDLMNLCVGYTENLQADSWGDIPYICPDPESSFHSWIGYLDGTISAMYDSSCRNIQSIFCDAIWPTSWRSTSYGSISFTTTTISMTPVSSVDMIAHFLAHYGYNSGRMYNFPHSYHSNDLSFLHQFVSSLYNCQNTIWQNIVKIDCSVMTSLLNILGYPQSDWQTSTSYPHFYKEYLNSNKGDNCRLFIDYIYTNFLDEIHKSVEYVSSGSGWAWSSGLTTKDNEGLSEWVLVVIVLLGIIGILGFSGLLFLLIYKMCRHKMSVYPDSQARYRPGNRDDVTVNITAERNATKAPPTPPPS